MTIIGLTGQKRAGKDSVAKLLVEEYGFIRLGFADRLKEMALEQDPVLDIDFGPNAVEAWNLGSLVAVYGWEHAKGFKAVRSYLQDFGLRVRDEVGEDYWLNYVMDQIDNDGTFQPVIGPRYRLRATENFVISDVRFPNEISAVWDRHGYIVRVERPGLANDDQHISETAWLQSVPDVTVRNEGTLEDLNRAVAGMMAGLEPSPRPA